MSSKPHSKATRSISIKSSIVEEIEAHVKKSKRYHSIAEFLNEAARLRLEKLGKHDKVKSHD